MALTLPVVIVSCSQKEDVHPAASVQVTIDNIQPRRDVNGQIIDAHGGCLQFFDGKFYLYGTAYGLRKDSLETNNYFCVYSSPDLEHWTPAGQLLAEQPLGVYTRPYVVFNPNTHKYVLWYNWFPTLWNGQAGVAVSDTPIGPFVVTNLSAHLAGKGPGDGSLFVDDDGKGYYIYTSMKENYGVRVERLKPDYFDTTGETGNVMATGCEAPVLFRRNNTYYALCGPVCPDCPYGSEVQVFTATSPLGPYTTKPQYNINRPLDSQVTFLEKNGSISRTETNNYSVIVAAQQTWVAKFPTADGGIYIWMGDRWESRPDGIKGHDFQFWSPPLEFSPTGDLMPLKNAGRWFLMK